MKFQTWRVPWKLKFPSIQNSTVNIVPSYAKALYGAFPLTITVFSLEEFKNTALFLRLGLSSTLAFHKNGAFRLEEFGNAGFLF